MASDIAFDFFLISRAYKYVSNLDWNLTTFRSDSSVSPIDKYVASDTSSNSTSPDFWGVEICTGTLGMNPQRSCSFFL